MYEALIFARTNQMMFTERHHFAFVTKIASLSIYPYSESIFQ